VIIVLNGRLGIGKSTLAEALAESIEGCAMMSGDHLLAVNPAPADEQAYLHAGMEALIAHHRRFGYRHLVIEHIWRTEAAVADLKARLGDPEFYCFLLTLAEDEHRRRVEQRQAAKAIDEREFEWRMFAEERRALEAGPGELLDVSGVVEVVVGRVLKLVGLR
jgi:2-phosphoglycerate kinase